MPAAIARGEVSELPACGTAAVVTPVGRIVSEYGRRSLGDGPIGPIARLLRDRLVAVQRGRAPDERGGLLPCN